MRNSFINPQMLPKKMKKAIALILVLAVLAMACSVPEKSVPAGEDVADDVDTVVDADFEDLDSLMEDLEMTGTDGLDVELNEIQW